MAKNNKDFNVNDIGIPNGRFFGMPFPNETCDVVLIPVPWDATVSYSEGSAKAPEAMIDASIQVDLFDEFIPNSSELKIGTDESNLNFNGEQTLTEDYIALLNEVARDSAKKIIARLESGKPLTKSLEKELNAVNQASEIVNQMVEQVCNAYYKDGIIPGVVGGEHSVAFGAIKAAANNYKSSQLGILQIDAHADLRKAYEGFEYSHASVMRNAIDKIGIKKLTQVGIRDFCSDEAVFIEKRREITSFTFEGMNNLRLQGIHWKTICEKISKSLPKYVYISFDIDGLEPSLCPNTGTPVPGGLSWGEALYLLRYIGKEHKIVGFDLNEVAPDKEGKNEWDANVGARLLHKLSLIAVESNR